MIFLILLNIILILVIIYFYLETKKLKQQIIDLEENTKTILERKLINNKEDLISLENISIEQKKESAPKKKKTPKVTNEDNNIETIEPIKQKKYTARNNDDEYYVPNIQNPVTPILQKNTSSSEDYNTKELTNTNPPKILNNIILSESFNPDEFIKKELLTDSKQDNDEYLKEIANKIKSELTTQIIDLTDYEKNQEEQAVISYQELLSLKEKNKNEEQSTTNLLADLKELRKLLD